MGMAQNGNAAHSRLRHICFALFCIIGSLVLSVLTAELTLRILGYNGAPEGFSAKVHRVDDPILNWRTIPNSEFKQGGVLYKYNSAGFRDVEHAIEKPPGITRIVVLGDSVSEGLGIQREYVFAHILQSQLGKKFEVINMGVHALNTPQEVHLFEQEGLKYNPELVLVNFVLNDCDFYSSVKDAQHSRPRDESRIVLLDIPINPELKRSLKSSAVVYFVHQRVHELKAKLMGIHDKDYYTRLWESQECRDRITNGFDKLALLQGKHQFNVVVVLWPFIADYDHYAFGFVHEWVKNQAQIREFKILDLIEAFAKLPYRSLQITVDDYEHANALGHRLAVESFMKWYRLE